MATLSRLILGVLFLASGVAAGVGMTAMLGGADDADPCRGTGQVARTIVGPADEGSQRFTVCRKTGSEVIFNEDGTPVLEDIRHEELIEYYQTHPAENPALTAQQTADADFAEKGFDVIELPSIPADPQMCATGSAPTNVEIAGIVLCLPDGWKLRQRAPNAVDVLGPGGIVGVFPPDLRGTTANRCARPQVFDAAAGQVKLCALPVDPIGGQGHGFVLPSGREGGMSVYDVQDKATRDLVFNILYSIQEIQQ